MGEWWHVEKGTTEDKVAETILQHTMVDATVEQVKQRLYGGFACGGGGIHVFHNTGAYTYLNPNGDVSAEDRAKKWKELLAAEEHEGFDPTAIFTSDSPRKEAGKDVSSSTDQN